MVPKEGVAVHINAFNFPIWGMLEKCAVNWMAGMPAVVKPATVTSYLTEAMVKAIIESRILPEGALQLIVGSAGDLLDHVESQDVVTFTGSATTGRMLKAHPRIIAESVPFNMEADSLNSIVLGPDATPDTDAGVHALHQGGGQGDDAEVRPALHRRAPHHGAREPRGGCADRLGQTPRRHRDRRPACGRRHA
jgi:acyl-CoA reductase-like NAD-dependent aldehyde dehydrogenase